MAGIVLRLACLPEILGACAKLQCTHQKRGSIQMKQMKCLRSRHDQSNNDDTFQENERASHVESPPHFSNAVSLYRRPSFYTLFILYTPKRDKPSSGLKSRKLRGHSGVALALHHRPPPSSPSSVVHELSSSAKIFSPLARAEAKSPTM